MSRNYKDHYKTTEELFKISAIEKNGYYDSIRGWPLKHTVWQLRVRKIVLRILHTLLKSAPAIVKIIDVGCGRGDFTIEIVRHFPQLSLIKGCDFVEDVLTIAQKHSVLYKNVSFQKADVTAMPFDDNFYDATICINVLHHIFKDDLEKALSELARITKKYLILEIKNINNFFYRHGVSCAHGINTYSTSVDNVSDLLNKFNLHLIEQRNVLLFNKISPVIILVYEKED